MEFELIAAKVWRLCVWLEMVFGKSPVVKLVYHFKIPLPAPPSWPTQNRHKVKGCVSGLNRSYDYALVRIKN